MLPMLPRRRAVLAGAALIAAPALTSASAQSRPALKVGVLTDLSGQYRDNSGPTSVLAARQAVEDFKPGDHGFDVEILAADHGQKPDLGAGIARQWFDRDGVDAIADLNNSAVALAALTVAREKDKALLVSGAASSELTGRYCSPNHVHWTVDTYAGPFVVGSALLKAGRKKWFLIVADYTFGHSLENGIATLVKAQGGEVVGSAAFPFPGTTDFSSYLVQAQASGADVLGICATGGDMEGCVKQGREFGLDRSGIVPAALLSFITEVHSMGLDTAQGLLLGEGFYWDLNDRTRAFTRRFLPKTPNNYPSALHAACYSAVTHYLRTAASAGVPAMRSGRAAIAAMKALPTDDDCFGSNRVRADGRFMNPVYLFQAKTPAESKGPWDTYHVRATIPPEQAWHPEDGVCRMP